MRNPGAVFAQQETRAVDEPPCHAQVRLIAMPFCRGYVRLKNDEVVRSILIDLYIVGVCLTYDTPFHDHADTRIAPGYAARPTGLI